MKKNINKHYLWALAVALSSLTFTSCSDDEPAAQGDGNGSLAVGESRYGLSGRA